MARFYGGVGGGSGESGPPGPAGPQGPAGADGAPGADGQGFNWRGDWSSNPSPAYVAGDVVRYNEVLFLAADGAGGMYPAGSGTPTTSPGFSGWTPMVYDGADGAPGQDGAQGPQGEQGIQGEAGPAGADGADALWNFVGEYNNGADYNIGDVVTYNGGTYYRILPANAGYAPGTEYWTLVAAAGADGEGLNWRGEWTSSPGLIGYTINDLVFYEGNVYIGISSDAVFNSPTPDQNTTGWEIFASKGADGATGADGAQGPQGPAGQDGADGQPYGNIDGGNASSTYGGIMLINGGSSGSF